MKEALFKAIWLDWRKPKLRVRLSDHPHDWYGEVYQFSLKSSCPGIATMDAWTAEDWETIHSSSGRNPSYSAALNRGKVVEIASHNIQDLEIIGFCNWDKPDRVKTIWTAGFRKEADWVYGPEYDIEALKSWDLTAYNLIRDPELLTLE